MMAVGLRLESLFPAFGAPFNAAYPPIAFSPQVCGVCFLMDEVRSAPLAWLLILGPVMQSLDFDLTFC